MRRHWPVALLAFFALGLAAFALRARAATDPLRGRLDWTPGPAKQAQLPTWLTAPLLYMAPAARDLAPFEPGGSVLSGLDVRHTDVFAVDHGYRMLMGCADGTTGIATSDNGVEFVPQTRKVLPGAKWTSTVRLDDGRWRTYFADSNAAVRSAITSDAEKWVEEPGIRLSRGPAGAPDSEGLERPFVMRMPDGRWRMYYDGLFPNPGTDQEPVNPILTILTAVSSDGLAWTKDDVICVAARRYRFPPGHVIAAWGPNVHHDGTSYVMYAAAFCIPTSMSGIHRAISADGLHFKMEDDAVIPMDVKYLPLLEQSVEDLRYIPMLPGRLETPREERLFYWTQTAGMRSASRPRSAAK